MAEGMKPELLLGGWRRVLASFKTLKQSTETLNARICVCVYVRENLFGLHILKNYWLLARKACWVLWLSFLPTRRRRADHLPSVFSSQWTLKPLEWNICVFNSNVPLTFVDNATAEHHTQHQVNGLLSPVSIAYLETTKRRLKWRSEAVGERNEHCVLAQVIVLAQFILAACENCKCNISNPKSHQVLLPSFIQGHSLSS